MKGRIEMSDCKEEEILHELRRITKLLALTATRDQIQKDRIAVLSSIGFQPKEIANLLGTTAGTVSVTLTTIRKKAKGKEGKIEESSDESESDDK